MKHLKFLLVGLVFGIVLIKSEVASWYRIQEMFRFQSFHMFGVIGSAVVLGALITFLAKRFQLKNIHGTPVAIVPVEPGMVRYIAGGLLFGLGWSLAGTCPGPMYSLIGSGFSVILVVLGGAFLGTIAYAYARQYLKH